MPGIGRGTAPAGVSRDRCRARRRLRPDSERVTVYFVIPQCITVLFKSETSKSQYKCLYGRQLLNDSRRAILGSPAVARLRAPTRRHPAVAPAIRRVSARRVRGQGPAIFRSAVRRFRARQGLLPRLSGQTSRRLKAARRGDSVGQSLSQGRDCRRINTNTARPPKSIDGEHR
jgi:hypothetical protein